MSYDHNFRIDITLRDNVTADQLIQALMPLVRNSQIEEKDLVRVLTKDLTKGRSSASQYEGEGISIHRIKTLHETLTLETYGDIDYNYPGTIAKVVEALSALSDKAGVATLTDLDTAEVESAITYIPFGPSLADRVVSLIETKTFIDFDLNRAFPSDMGPEAMERIKTLAMEVQDVCEKHVLAFQRALTQEARALVEKALKSPLAEGETTLGEYLQRHKTQQQREEESDQDSPGQTP